MKRVATISFVAATMLLPLATLGNESDDTRILFDFDGQNAADDWQTVNDGVMGGRSIGKFRITEDRTMVFSGTLSLENNGGFASVRSQNSQLSLQAGDSILIRVRGDGRRYSLNLYNTNRQTAFSYRSEFSTVQGEWQELRLPLDEFVATWFGRTLKNKKLTPSQISGLGFLIADKQAGAFELEIDWIQAARKTDNDAN